MSVDRRKMIVEAAGKSFSLFGYKATTMDQVAKIANVGKGTIYTFFSNKEELFDEIMRNFIAEMKDIAERKIEQGAPFLDNLNRVLFEMLDFRKTHELTIKLSHEVMELGTPAAQDGMRKVEQAILAYLRGYIEEAVAQGDLRACDPEKTAFVMLKLYIALVYDWERSHSPLSKQEIAELFQLYLIEGLAPAR
ncbi:TetR/AcrR family transcriptional regulator [Paenibacillus sp. J31TS4]|uniref:TetR/AcrR family transcriptional regulator n=1 Tax=Paenibacillus sp. J31TS4 TaxID=2807195 RepID=UPI001BCC5888|nr:TetR/AcrR family transcriptional regulator [Paenibacillus sp. J31TS4]